MSVDNLFKPLTIGPTELSGRIVSTSHQTTLVEGHLPTDEFIAYQEARARGGVSLIIMEAVAIAPSGLLTAHTLGGYLDEMADGYRRIVAALRPHGAKVFVQLFHGGREMISSAPKPVVSSSSALPSHRYHTEPRALRAQEVEQLVAAYGHCAELAADAGMDGIEITAAHGYLGQQFFDPTMNRRTDRYADGPRFLVETVDTVRAAAPDIALGVRLSADSEAARHVAAQLIDRVDYVHVALGDSSTFDGCSGIVPPPPTPRNLIAEFTEPFRLGVPLIATSRVVDPVDASQLVERGVADAIGMNRALITDPDMPRKARSGKRILYCVGCNACIAHYHAETPIRCTQNPRTGRELYLRPPTPEGTRERIVVVGAGPAGLSATAEAIENGNDVVLLEREERIGGQVLLAGQAPAHCELAATLVANYQWLLTHPNVDVRLGVHADADVVAELEADRLVVATGAKPFLPPHRLDDVKVITAWDVLAGARPTGRVLVADWGGDWAGLDCAEALVAKGVPVTLAVGSVTPGETLHQYQRNQYLSRLYRAGVSIRQHAGLFEANGGTVRFRNIFAPEIEIEIEADVLVLALGRIPDDGLAIELDERGLATVEAGDCRSPRSLEEAILEGTMAVGGLTTRKLSDLVTVPPTTSAAAPTQESAR